MSQVDIRVDLPSFSRSFVISVSSLASVRQIKQEIYRTCPGQPRPDGQRLIWRGRLLADDENVERLWKSDPRVIHLAVHPSAWSASPPPPQLSGPKLPSLTRASSVPFSPYFETRFPMAQNECSNLTYIIYQHQLALSSLSSDIPPPAALENLEYCRLVAKDGLNNNGWIWPAILDVKIPNSSSDGSLLYSFTVIEGHPYLRLSETYEKLTARQENALKILTCTLSILTMPPASPALRSAPQAISIPPHVNQLLQQIGLPALHVGNNEAIGNPNNAALGEIREMAIRPLIAPLAMLILRTVLLLYFVAPARKPIFSILIFAWMLYEIWQPIRNALRNGGAAVGENQRQEGVGAEAGGGHHVAAAADAVPGTVERQLESMLNKVAKMNVANEERVLNSRSGVGSSEPGVGHKVATFIGLLVSTVHPGIWNRRRVTLRRREGRIRSESDGRNVGAGDWVERYVARVMNEEWVDDSDA